MLLEQQTHKIGRGGTHCLRSKDYAVLEVGIVKIDYLNNLSINEALDLALGGMHVPSLTLRHFHAALLCRSFKSRCQSSFHRSPSHSYNAVYACRKLTLTGLHYKWVDLAVYKCTVRKQLSSVEASLDHQLFFVTMFT